MGTQYRTVPDKTGNRRFDLLIDNSLVIRSAAKQMRVWHKLEQLPAKFISLPFFVLISKKLKYVHLLPKVDQIIKAMKKDSTLKNFMVTIKEWIGINIPNLIFAAGSRTYTCYVGSRTYTCYVGSRTYT